MRSLDKRINRKDPSGLRSTEDARGVIAQHDFDLVLARIIQNTQGITDPMKIQRIVEIELRRYGNLVTQKYVVWIMDTMNRSSARADLMLKTLGVQIMPTFGEGIVTMSFAARPFTSQLRDALTINVKNQISSLTADTQKKVTQSLIESVDAGAGVRETANNIMDCTAMERNRAEMIARTETMRAYVDTSMGQYRRYGVEQVKWLIASDERTCEECEAHDGEIYGIDDAPDCPAHPNCRCVLLPVIEEVGP